MVAADDTGSNMAASDNITRSQSELNRSDEDADYLPPLMLIPYTGFSVPVYGVVSPPVILITLVTNSLICIVLLRRNMRNPTNILLVAMAISDMLTGLLPLPCFWYFYTMGNYIEYVPYEWCYAYRCLVEYIPIIFHTASIWLTVVLAVQRYVCVCQPLLSKKWCTTPNALRSIAVVYVVATFSQITRFFEFHYVPVDTRSRVDASLEVSTCRPTYSPFVQEYMNVYFNMYYWFRVVFIHLVPCTMLGILNGLLVQTMRTAQRRRHQLLKQNRKSECRRLAESNLTTLMLVVVVGAFLLVEFPLALLLIVMIVDNTFDLSLLDENAMHIAPMLINLFILLSYPINFFIYCGMSRQFRETFKGLFTGRSVQLTSGPLQTTVSGANQTINVNIYQAVNTANLQPL